MLVAWDMYISGHCNVMRSCAWQSTMAVAVVVVAGTYVLTAGFRDLRDLRGPGTDYSYKL